MTDFAISAIEITGLNRDQLRLTLREVTTRIYGATLYVYVPVADAARFSIGDRFAITLEPVLARIIPFPKGKDLTQ